MNFFNFSNNCAFNEYMNSLFGNNNVNNQCCESKDVLYAMTECFSNVVKNNICSWKHAVLHSMDYAKEFSTTHDHHDQCKVNKKYGLQHMHNLYKCASDNYAAYANAIQHILGCNTQNMHTCKSSDKNCTAEAK